MGAGRQREFNEEQALDAAMVVFWSNGYNGTSLSDLTHAMGINKPSLYAAYGNKEALFIRALKHYVDKHGVPHMDLLSDASRNLQSRLRDYLRSVARMMCDPCTPGGCFVAATTQEAGGDCLPTMASSEITTINQRTRAGFVDVFERAVEAGQIGRGKSSELLADYLMTLQYGLAVLARNGASLETLDAVIEYASASF